MKKSIFWKCDSIGDKRQSSGIFLIFSDQNKKLFLKNFGPVQYSDIQNTTNSVNLNQLIEIFLHFLFFANMNQVTSESLSETSWEYATILKSNISKELKRLEGCRQMSNVDYCIMQMRFLHIFFSTIDSESKLRGIS